MKNLLSIVVAAIALGPFCAPAADLTEQERAELRQRAQEYQTERSRNPGFEPGEARLNREPGELRAMPRTHHASKARSGARKGHTARERKVRARDETRTKGAKPRIRDRVKQIKKLPGALVRR